MINLGFIGVGGYGEIHLRGFLPHHHDGRVRICALADASPSALAAAGKLTGLPSAAAHLDYQELLDRDDLHAVVISTPISSHRKIALHAIEKGLFVLLEKPPVPLRSELRELIAADAGRRVMVAFQHIYKPIVRQMKAAVWNGEIGRPIAISAWGIWPRTSEYYGRSAWAGELFDDGRVVLDGPCTNAMAHFINSMFFIAGRSACEYASPQCLEGEVYRARPIAGYDLGAFRGLLDNGIKFCASFSHASANLSPARIRVRGTNGVTELSENATKLRDPQGRIFSCSDGREELRHAFLNFVEGDASQNLTDLPSMEPYVMATNMMLQSSRGIRTIPETEIAIHLPGTPGAIYTVPGLEEIFDFGSRNQTSLRESGARWANSSQMLTARDFDERKMLNFLRMSEPQICNA